MESTLKQMSYLLVVDTSQELWTKKIQILSRMQYGNVLESFREYQRRFSIRDQPSGHV